SLLTDKTRKAVHIVSRGGMYSEGPAKEFELGDKYIRTILGFLGIYDVETLAFENANVFKGNDLEEAINRSYDEAKELARKF
ncbi:MAG: NAD(P)H-dependent oxidoreductase, partial [Cetobacterium sp.]|uniref:NAD(P)H-dependent oxidoreductase n=1 Tax=Cetobacterium sp. TaxID=2071632 RepID=UPI003F38D0F1